jgi:hypothetical protein
MTRTYHAHTYNHHRDRRTVASLALTYQIHHSLAASGVPAVDCWLGGTVTQRRTE